MALINDTDSADERAAGYEEIASEMLRLAQCAATRVAHEQFTMLAALYGKLARRSAPSLIGGLSTSPSQCP